MKKIGVIIGAYENLRPGRESTLAITDALESRGHEVLFAKASDVAVNNTSLRASFSKLQLDSTNSKFEPRDRSNHHLNSFDLILYRPNPPIDLQYLNDLNLHTFLTTTPVINPPRSLLVFNEKTSIFHLEPETRPLSICSRSPGQIISFIRSQDKKKWVVKPINDFGGNDITLINDVTKNSARDLLDRKTDYGETHMMVQEFLPEVHDGDKRVLIANDKIVGFANRVPGDEEWIANHHSGASYEKCKLTSLERDRLNKVIDLLNDFNITYAGVDLIGEKVIEINVTSPGSIIGINNVTGQNIQEDIVDRFLELSV